MNLQITYLFIITMMPPLIQDLDYRVLLAKFQTFFILVLKRINSII